MSEESVRLCTGGDVQYKAFVRTFGHAPVLVLVATCIYGDGGGREIFFMQNPGADRSWSLMEKTASVHFELVTFYGACLPDSHGASGSFPVPEKVSIRDSRGVHDVVVTPWG